MARFILIYFLSFVLIAANRAGKVGWIFKPNAHPLEVEIIGSLILATIVGVFIYKFQEVLQVSGKRENSKRVFFGLVLPNIQKSFLRNSSILNTSNVLNNRAYFDNSSINNLYDVIKEFAIEILTYRQYHPNDQLPLQLLTFKENADKAFIEGERLDGLLLKMAKICHLLPDSNKRHKNLIIFFKGKNYAKFSKEELQVMLESDEKANLHDFVNSSFSNPETNLKLSYYNQYKKLDPQMKKIVSNLNEECISIKLLINQNYSANVFSNTKFKNLKTFIRFVGFMLGFL